MYQVKSLNFYYCSQYLTFDLIYLQEGFCQLLVYLAEEDSTHRCSLKHHSRLHFLLF